MDISIVIPVRNEAENIAPLIAEIRAALAGMPGTTLAYEIVYVDDGNDPADIPRLWAMAQAASGAPALITGQRTKRRDSWTKRVSSRIANRVRAALLGDGTPDTGCGLKLFRRELFLALPFFDHMHRFLPALVRREGGDIVSVPVNHRPRTRGSSNYGTLDRLAVAFADLLGVIWLQRRAKTPRILPGK